MGKPTCSRCGVTLHGNAETMPHLCADIVKRHARRAREAGAVEALILEYCTHIGPEGTQQLAERIVAKLVQMGVHDE